MKKGKTKYIVIALIILAIPFLVKGTVNLLKAEKKSYEPAEIIAMMEKHLYEKYGEEFVVDRLGTRTFGDIEYYQARIYPVSIIGTNKEGDKYYQAEANIDILESGKLREPGDTYGGVIVKERAENYLLPKVKKIFGERVQLKIQVSYYTRNKYGTMVGYLTPDFHGALEKSINDPENNRLMLDIDVYIFDRIEDEEEKEERRRQIFDFIQYLKEEGLFKYLEMGVIFIDERVLAPGYAEFDREIFFSRKVREEIEGKAVYMPPMELRERMSRELQAEIDRMSEEELLESMGRIKKSELTPEQIANYNRQYLIWICSINMLKETRSSRYEREKKEGNLDFYHYNDVNNIIFAEDPKYIYE